MFSAVKKETDLFKPSAINSFLGARTSENILNSQPSQLISNQNMEHWISGSRSYLRTKRGSELLMVIANRVYGAGKFIHNVIISFLIFMDENGTLKYFNPDDSSTGTIQTGFVAGNQTNFVQYSSEASALYMSTPNDGVFKVSGATPVYAAIPSSPDLSCMWMSTASGRMFGAYGNLVRFTEIQLHPTNFSNLETWNTATNYATVADNSQSGFVAGVEIGQASYIAKDTGIFVHINPTEATIDWRFPKAQAEVGTKSPKTFLAAKYKKDAGIIYLGTDKTLRFFPGYTVQNAGKLPTVFEDQSVIISNPFQKYLNDIPDALLSECAAIFFGNYYILNFPGKNQSGLTMTIFVDTSKTLPQEEGDDIPQPYHFTSLNMDYTDMVILDGQLYGFHKNGFISRLLSETSHVEEFPGEDRAIEYKAFLSWQNFSGTELVLQYLYLNWNDISDSRARPTVTANSFLLGESPPNIEDGEENVIQSQRQYPLWDQVAWDQFNWDDEDAILSQSVDLHPRGHYFSFGISNDRSNEPIEVYGFQPLFKISREDSVGKR